MKYPKGKKSAIIGLLDNDTLLMCRECSILLTLESEGWDYLDATEWHYHNAEGSKGSAHPTWCYCVEHLPSYAELT